MLTHPTTEKLNAMRLYGMVKSLEEQRASSGYEGMSFEERLGLIVDREVTEQENRRLHARLKQAGLGHEACMENIDYRQNRGLDKSLMSSLASCRWIKDGLNVLVTGPCGVGKSFIARALGHKACREGYRVFNCRAPRLFEELNLARGDGRYIKFMKSLARRQLMIIDDWGFSVLNEVERRDLLEILEDRHQRYSTIITSQLPIEHWHETIGNPTLADAILDRVVHNAHKICLTGSSMRKIKASNPSEKA